MAKFKLSGLVTISIQTEVEADSLDQAIQIANQRQDVLNGEFDGGADINEHWIAEDYDGMPFNIKELDE